MAPKEPEFGDPRGFDLLQAALSSPTSLIQTAAISSLGELGDPRAIPLLLPFANNEDWQIRYRLVQALGHLGGDEARVALENFTRDEVEQVANPILKRAYESASNASAEGAPNGMDDDFLGEDLDGVNDGPSVEEVD